MADYLYIHIPFCVRKCAYCDFLSLSFDDLLAKRYVKALCAELVMRRKAAGKLNTIYIGGGTPSLLAPGLFDRIFACLRDNFAISSSAEITVEANPGTVSSDSVRRLHVLGVNRISMGVQSFNDRDLKLLGRIHSSEQAIRSVGIVRSAGIHNISLDLMYGIPGQTIAEWKTNLARAVDLAVPHVSAYELTPEPGTPFHDSITKGPLQMPDEGDILSMFDATAETLASAGIEQYEVSNYARPGYQCRHNLNYWDRGEYMAAGAGAHSFENGARTRNAGNVITYIERLEMSELPVEESTHPTRDEALRENIFLGLRKTEGISLQKCPANGRRITQLCSDLIEDGLLQLTGGAISFTRRGMAISNEVLVQIFRRLGL